MKHLLYLSMFVALLGIAGCSGATDSGQPPRALTKEEASLVESDNVFGLRMFSSINRSWRDKNLFVSPLSVSMALGMTLNGASGATRDSMARTLELAGLTEQEINTSYRSLIDLLRGLDPKVTFRIANSIWYRPDLGVEQGFIDLNKSYFDAEVTKLDFASPAAPSMINGWVDRNTNGLIKSIVDQIGKDMVMYLINAIYFKGSWATKFGKDSTSAAPFNMPGGSSKQVQMMFRSGSFSHGTYDGVQVVDLPYGSGKYSMTIVLPKSEGSVEELAEGLTSQRWASWIAGLHPSEGEVFLPRFKMEWTDSLNAVLKAMGMEIAFDPDRADFTRIDTNGGIFISEVKHKTYVDVNEEGTEAAAVTSVGMQTTSLPQRFKMRMDRPFLFVIREHHSGSILFLGKVVEPQ